MSDKTGGSIFPAKWEQQEEFGTFSGLDGGLTIRDYIAAKALPRVIGTMVSVGSPECQQDAAWLAYSMADAMLKARES